MHDMTVVEEQAWRNRMELIDQAVGRIVDHGAGMLDAAIDQLFAAKRDMESMRTRANKQQIADAAGLGEMVVSTLAEQLPLDPESIVGELDPECTVDDRDWVIDQVRERAAAVFASVARKT